MAAKSPKFEALNVKLTLLKRL